MEALFNVTSDNVTTFNRTTNYPELHSHCYHLYEYSRTVYIPFLHALVMITGLVVNLYMVITLHCACSKDSSPERKGLSDIDVFFSHLGLCDIATLLTIPVWVTQNILVKGWVFGYLVCKLIKGLLSVCSTTTLTFTSLICTVSPSANVIYFVLIFLQFCFQYGILLMVYINIDRYMKVVHNRPTLKCLGNRRTSSRRRIISRLCACGPAVSALVDICYYTVHPISRDTMMCFNGMTPHFQLVTFWIRINVCFILPIVLLVYCK